ncbi:hypothetical protein [Saccharothrix stipae]
MDVVADSIGPVGSGISAEEVNTRVIGDLIPRSPFRIRNPQIYGKGGQFPVMTPYWTPDHEGLGAAERNEATVVGQKRDSRTILL